MRRWHSPREHAIMFARWKFEMGLHGYDWRNPPDPKCDKWACHCAAGIGSMRKQRPLSGPWAKWEKWYDRQKRSTRRRAEIQYELDAG